MTPRLVIPSDASPDDVAYPGTRPETWQELADNAGCDQVETFGSQWCLDNLIDGLGIATEYVAPPVAPPAPPQLVGVLYSALVATEAPMAASDLAASLADAIAPLVGGV